MTARKPVRLREVKKRPNPHVMAILKDLTAQARAGVINEIFVTVDAPTETAHYFSYTSPMKLLSMAQRQMYIINRKLDGHDR